MVMALRMLTALARGETPDPSRMKDTVPADQLEAALGKANAELIEALDTVDLRKTISLPRGPRGPWDAPAGVYCCRRTLPECGNWAQLRR